MNDPNPDLLRRVAELEAELARTRAERDEYKATAYELIGHVLPYDPPTPEEIHNLRFGPRGASPREVLAEFQRQIADDPEQQ